MVLLVNAPVSVRSMINNHLLLSILNPCPQRRAVDDPRLTCRAVMCNAIHTQLEMGSAPHALDTPSPPFQNAMFHK